MMTGVMAQPLLFNFIASSLSLSIAVARISLRIRRSFSRLDSSSSGVLTPE